MLACSNNVYNECTIDYKDFPGCPEDYQRYIIKILSNQAYAEYRGSIDVAAQLDLAPNYKARLGLAKIAYDEANHAAKLFTILEKVGISEKEALRIVFGDNPINEKKSDSLRGIEAVGNRTNQWLDIVLNNLLMDGAGIYMVNNFAKSSFSPWAKACQEIALDEKGHKSFGLKQLQDYLKKHPDDINKKFTEWYIMALNFFGPPNNKSRELLKNYGIKRNSNEELRQAFIQDMQNILSHDLNNKIQPVDFTDSYPYQLI